MGGIPAGGPLRLVVDSRYEIVAVQIPRLSLRIFVLLATLIGIVVGLGLRWKAERDRRWGAAKAALQQLFPPTKSSAPRP